MDNQFVNRIKDTSVSTYKKYLQLIKCPRGRIEDEIIKQSVCVYEYSYRPYTKTFTGMYDIDIESSCSVLDTLAKNISDNTLRLLEKMDSSSGLSLEALKEKIVIRKPFDQPEPIKPTEPDYPAASECKYPAEPQYPREPRAEDYKYRIESPSLLDRLINKRTAMEKQNELIVLFEKDHAEWERKVEDLQKTHKKMCDELRRNHDSAVSKRRAEYVEAVELYNQKLEKYNDDKRQYEKDRENEDNSFLDFIGRATNGNTDAVQQIYKHILESIELPFEFKLTGETEYHPDNNTLLMDVLLPARKDLPDIKSIKWIKSKHEVKVTHQTDAYMQKYYDSVIYQMVLLVIHHCLSHKTKAVYPSVIVFNGYVQTTDPATGKSITPCILSVSTTRDDFKELVLNAIDAKAWFKEANGVAAAKIYKTTPILPIQKLDKTDHRFVDGYEVMREVDEGVNIAAMDWQDFENLVRELFEKELSSSDGEVMITQPSRDGGVDAVAFDPDPIRGGKIVIQAKRYTNVVGVSAVRDLYGTVVNEGAIKGILVTTSGYGNDAYEFAKNKPITLLDGGNILALLEKHGHKARIDLAEAKRINGEKG